MFGHLRLTRLAPGLLLLAPTVALAFTRPCSTCRSGQAFVGSPYVLSSGSGTSASSSQGLDSAHNRLGRIPDLCPVITADTAFGQAYKAFRDRDFATAIQIAKQGLTEREDARLYLIKGVSELTLGQCVEAETTIEQYRNALKAGNVLGLDPAKERVNGPMRVRFQEILQRIDRREAPLETARAAAVQPPRPGLTVEPATKQPTRVPAKTSGDTLTVEQLVAEFKADAAAANAKYANKDLQLVLTGKVQEAAREGGRLEVMLGEGAAPSVVCSGFADDVAVEGKLMPGDTITVRAGRLLAFIAADSVVVLVKCELLDPKP